MPIAKVNGQEIEFQDGMTVLQVCEQAGEEIPRFCYHERLKVAGNCRMCLVEIKPGPPKPSASCAMPAGDGMEISTNSEMVKKAREGVMEFLLINHPLDCPICDQGGECDLQDQAMAYGRGDSRFDEHKRGVKDKYMGPLIKPHMTRCIHCTRCIRFLTDVAGCDDMGATGRGEDMEVGTFVEKAIGSELSGNIIDLCPVGALTSRPYAFKARSWELRKTETIDVLDAVGSNIRVDSRQDEVMRILPRLNEAVNEEWISDKTRFAYDGLKYQRLDRPYVRKQGRLEPSNWREAFEIIAKKAKRLEGKQVAAIAGDMADAEAMLTLKRLLEAMGSPHMDCRQDGVNLGNDPRNSYLFNTTIAGIEQADALLLVGVNPRLEAPIINARIRKRRLMGDFPIAAIGPDVDYGYDVEYLGANLEALDVILKKKTIKAERPMVIVGSAVLQRNDSAHLLATLHTMCNSLGMVKEGWNGYNVLHRAASRVAGLDMGFLPQRGGKDVEGIMKAVEGGDIKMVYLLGADEIAMKRLKKAFVVYQGHHGDAGASHADVVLPGAAYTEKNATYVNTEGRVQQTQMAIFPPGEAREDWKIISELADVLGYGKIFNQLSDVRKGLEESAISFANVGAVSPAEWQEFGKKGKFLKTPLTETIDNFYQTDVISRASRTMAECTSVFGGKVKQEAA